jgi:hypothetical protein
MPYLPVMSIFVVCGEVLWLGRNLFEQTPSPLNQVPAQIFWVHSLFYGIPVTLVPVFLFDVVLSPSAPSPLLPQHFAVPLLKRAQEKNRPVVMATAELTFETSTGEVLAIFVPSPT